MPGTLQPDRYHRGDTGDFRQTDGTTDSEVLGWLGGLVYANVAPSTAISNTASETAFDVKATLPANTLQAGSVVKIRYMVTCPNTNGTETLAVKLYIATDLTAGSIVGTTLISHAATDTADGNTLQGEYELIVRTAGTSGTVVGCGTYKSVPAAEGTATYKDDILASTTINTQAIQYIAVTATNNAANTAHNTILQFLRVELYK
jgi:hypothetical protein